MTLPPSTAEWQNHMGSAPETAKVLQNIQDEPCLPVDAENEFFRRLTARGTPANHLTAWEHARASVWEPPALNFKRKPVDVLRFHELVRFVLPEKLPNVLPGLSVNRFGMTLAQLERATLEELEDVIVEIASQPELRLSRTTWVAEAGAELDAATERPAELMDRLGVTYLLEQINANRNCVELRYARVALPASAPLHVPSVLDGIDNPPFRPVSDCSTPCGATAPLTPTLGTGFSEAIHAPCTVSCFKVRLLVP